MDPSQSGTASLVYSTFLGPAGSNPNAIAVDSSGDAYVTGNMPNGYPITAGAFAYTGADSASGGVYVTELNSTASLVYSTFLGPAGSNPNAIAVDSSGDAYVTGNMPNGYPITAGAFAYTGADSASGGVYVTELNSTGSALV